MEPMGSSPTAPPSKFKLQKLLFFLRKFWWVPVLTLTLGLGVGATIFYFTPPIFVSYGSLWETEKMQLPGGASYVEDRDSYLGTQVKLLQSDRLRQLTLTWMKAMQTNSIVLGADGEPLPVEIQVYTSPQNSVYSLEARSLNPAYTPAYLNALMNQFLEFRHNSRSQISGDTLTSISEQVQRVERDLKADQAILTSYERTNNFAVLEQANVTQGAYLSKLKTDLSDYQLQMKFLDAAALDQSAAHPGTTNTTDALFDSLRNSATDSGRLEAERQLELLKAQRKRLSKYLRDQHPKIVKLDEDIARSQKLIDLYERQSQEKTAADRQALQIKITNTENSIKQYEAKVESSSALLASADTLRQNVARNQSMYERLLSLLQNVDISRNIDQDNLAILEPAGPAKRSYREGETMVALASFIGLAIGLGIIFLLVWRDDRFTSIAEVTERFGDNVVGQVPEMPERPGGPPVALLSHNDDRHMFAESYRNLRSALLYVAVDGRRPKVILVTSAIPNEGKSTVATNLARTMALGGSKVLLIDADLRKGHIHERLKLPGKPGLNELLQQVQDSASFIQSTDLENLKFLPRGSISRNPGDLFLDSTFDQLLDQLRAQYDYVIVDSSPVFAADDASTLAPKMDGTLFIVRSRFSNTRVVREALDLLFQRQARVLGLVLNRSDATARSYYAYKYAEYYTTAEVVEADEKT